MRASMEKQPVGICGGDVDNGGGLRSTEAVTDMGVQYEGGLGGEVGEYERVLEAWDFRELWAMS